MSRRTTSDSSAAYNDYPSTHGANFSPSLVSNNGLVDFREGLMSPMNGPFWGSPVPFGAPLTPQNPNQSPFGSFGAAPTPFGAQPTPFGAFGTPHMANGYFAQPAGHSVSDVFGLNPTPATAMGFHNPYMQANMSYPNNYMNNGMNNGTSNGMNNGMNHMGMDPGFMSQPTQIPHFMKNPAITSVGGETQRELLQAQMISQMFSGMGNTSCGQSDCTSTGKSSTMNKRKY